MINNLIMLCMYHRDMFVDTKAPPYMNIQCGRAYSGIALDMVDDSVGVSIAERNKFWSKSLVYFGHKNLELPEYVGLCSYRRFFNGVQSGRPLHITPTSKSQQIISSINYSSMIEALESYDVILPVPYTYRQSLKSVITRNYYLRDFELLESVIAERSPDFLLSFRRVLASNALPGHNMFIMHRDKFREYCGWAFDICFP